MGTKRVRGWVIVVLIVAADVFPSSLLLAQDDSWTNATDGKWEAAGNWDQGSPSSSQMLVLFTNANPKTVTIDATTSGSFPATLTISNLVVSGAASTTNTLLHLSA